MKHDFQALSWRRARDIFGSDYCVFSSAIHPNDIEQGLLGDCYFLSALSALAEWPERIRNLFVTQNTNQAGVYTMRLFVNGELYHVTVD